LLRTENAVENRDIYVNNVVMFGKLELKKNLSQQKIDKIIFDYVRYNLIYDKISQNENLSKTTVWKVINKFTFNKNYNDNLEPIEDIIYTDTVYFKWVWALTIFNSWYYRKPIHWIWSDYERKQTYIDWFNFIEKKWWIINWVVIDIMRWVKNYLEKVNIPVQYCIFHQQQVTRRYITKKPKLEQNKELKDISLSLWKFSYNTVKLRLEDWYKRNKEWLSEKNENWNYVHEKTRKAYRSLSNNLLNLYTYERYSYIWFEKTNNLSEWINSIIKDKFKIHRWLKANVKKNLISYLLYNWHFISTQS